MQHVLVAAHGTEVRVCQLDAGRVAEDPLVGLPGVHGLDDTERGALPRADVPPQQGQVGGGQPVPGGRGLMPVRADQRRLARRARPGGLVAGQAEVRGGQVVRQLRRAAGNDIRRSWQYRPS